jgi:hypothetical protein
MLARARCVEITREKNLKVKIVVGYNLLATASLKVSAITRRAGRKKRGRKSKASQ